MLEVRRGKVVWKNGKFQQSTINLKAQDSFARENVVIY